MQLGQLVAFFHLHLFHLCLQIFLSIYYMLSTAYEVVSLLWLIPYLYEAYIIIFWNSLYKSTQLSLGAPYPVYSPVSLFS